MCQILFVIVLSMWCMSISLPHLCHAQREHHSFSKRHLANHSLSADWHDGRSIQNSSYINPSVVTVDPIILKGFSNHDDETKLDREITGSLTVQRAEGSLSDHYFSSTNPTLLLDSPDDNGIRPKRSYPSVRWQSTPAIPWTEINDTASKNISSENSTSYHTRIIESGLIAPNLGLVMEQVGSYMEYTGYTYVPTIYHMPHLATTDLTSKGAVCNMTANHIDQKMIINILREKIGTLIPQHRYNRSKRFIETAILGGAVAWNRASIWSLQDAISSLDNQLSEMAKHNQIVTTSINTLIDNQHAIHHAVDRQARIIREFVEKSSCEEFMTLFFREVYSTWLALAPNDFARVVDNALSGKITPDLLPAADVISVLLKHPALVDTAYSKDMTLLYQLGKFSLHKVTFEPYPMVSGVMIFPKILPDRSAALMSIYTTHLLTHGGYKKLELPASVACRELGNCWSISPTSCKEMLTLTLCQRTTKIEFNTCLKHLLVNKKTTTSCEWNLATSAETEVISFSGGVLIGAGNPNGEVMIAQGKNLIVHKGIDPSSSPILLTAEDGDYLHMDGRIYQLTQDTLRTGYEIKTNLTVPFQTEQINGLELDGWILESKIPQLKSRPWSPPHHYTWWVLICVLGVVLIIVLLLCRYKVLLQRLHTKVKNEISGWVSTPSAPPFYYTAPPRFESPRDLVI